MKKMFLAASAAVLLLCSVACSTTTMIDTLAEVERMAEIAASTLGAAGVIPAPIATAVDGYLTSVTAAIDEAVTETESSDSVETKSLKIASYFAAAAIPDLTGAPVSIQTALAAVQAAIRAYLAALAPVTADPNVAHAAATATLHLSLHDHLRLHSIQAKARKLHSRFI